MKIHVFEKVRCQEATWAEVEPKWSPRGSQDGAQEGAKTSPRGSQDGPKNDKKSEVNLGRVSVCLGRVKVSPRVLLRGRWGSKGRLVGKLPPPSHIEVDFFVRSSTGWGGRVAKIALELSQSTKKRMKVKEWQVVTRLPGE